jgi:hypothetical protein
VQVNLRIKEHERRRLEKTAKENGVSLNAEMAARLARTFQQQQLLDVDQVHENLFRTFKPLLEDVHGLMRTQPLMRAVDDLLRLIQPLLATRVIDGPTGQAVREAIDKIHLLESTIDTEAGRRLRGGAAIEGGKL